jgi:hypothetical protein
VADATHNLRLMIPFVRTAWELERCLNLVQAHSRAASIPVWVMAEVPSVAYWIPTYWLLPRRGCQRLRRFLRDIGCTGCTVDPRQLSSGRKALVRRAGSGDAR